MDITKDECCMLCDFIERNIIQNIRDDKDIDNMTWLVNITDLFKRMAEQCEYDGFTYSVKQIEKIKKELENGRSN